MCQHKRLVRGGVGGWGHRGRDGGWVSGEAEWNGWEGEGLWGAQIRTFFWVFWAISEVGPFQDRTPPPPPAFSGPKRPKKGTYLGGWRGGGGSGPGTARPPKYVPFTAFSSPKRPKKGTYLGGGGGSGPGTALFRPKKTQKRYVLVRGRPRNTCPLRRFQAQKDPKKVRIWESAGGGGGPVRERPDLRNTCPLRRLQAQKDPKKVRIWEGGGSGPGTALFRPKKTQKRYVLGPGTARPVFRPKRPKKGTYLGGVQDRPSVSKCSSRSALRYSSLLS